MESLPESPLRIWRLSAGISQERLAKRMKVGVGTISRWERWVRFPEQQYFRPLYDISKGAITPNSFVHWLVPSQSAGPPSPQLPPKRARRNFRKEAPHADHPARTEAA